MDKVEVIRRVVTYRASRRFREGRYDNPYGDHKYADTALRTGMAMIFQEEMDTLIHSKVCPCCGEFTMQDFDW